MKRSEIAISASLVPVDYLMVIVAGLASFYMRYWEPIVEIRPVIFDLRLAEFLRILWPVALIWLFSFWLAGLYSMRSTRRTIDEISKIILGCSTAVMILMFLLFFSRHLFDSRFIILAGWLFSIIFTVGGRLAIRAFQHYLYRFGIGVHRIVMIGDGPLAGEIKDNFQKNINSGYHIVDQLTDFDSLAAEKLNQLAEKDKFDEILVAKPDLDLSQTRTLNDFSYLNHVTLKYVADIFDFPIGNLAINNISGFPIVEVKKTSLDGWGKIYKRIFDFILSVFFIVLSSPILLLTIAAIKMDSRGPIFFKYQRIGQFGKPFTYFKFRSMIKDAHRYRFDKKFLNKHQNLRAGTPMIKFKDDPRVTRVGGFIRRYSIDELPELFNVLIGRMSLVGPRPHEIEEVSRYQTRHRKVLTIKPGMTGLAQVSGRSDLDFEEEIKLDTWYMENWSIKLDLIILIKTPLAVLRKRSTD